MCTHTGNKSAQYRTNTNKGAKSTYAETQILAQSDTVHGCCEDLKFVAVVVWQLIRFPFPHVAKQQPLRGRLWSSSCHCLRTLVGTLKHAHTWVFSFFSRCYTRIFPNNFKVVLDPSRINSACKPTESLLQLFLAPKSPDLMVLSDPDGHRGKNFQFSHKILIQTPSARSAHTLTHGDPSDRTQRRRSYPTFPSWSRTDTERTELSERSHRRSESLAEGEDL